MNKKKTREKSGLQNTYIRESVEELMSFGIPPYWPVSIDAHYGHLRAAMARCLQCHSPEKRDAIIQRLSNLWITKANRNPIIPCLSVRSGFDLFLQAKNYPPGSEVIMSAINIPDMATIVTSHGLVVVPLDISIDTVEPKLELLPALISEKTVALVLTHLYGRWMDVEPFLAVARRHKLVVVEDCAECFAGFDIQGHPDTDIALFSFGAIKFYTSFGGSIAKVRDKDVLERMKEIHGSYPVQASSAYLKKLLKYSVVYSVLQTRPFPNIVRGVGNKFSIDYKDMVVSMMRGFPDQMIQKIRAQPSTALLATMLSRQQCFSQSEFSLQRLKGDYFISNIPSGMDPVGYKAKVNNFWLFPVLLDDPETMLHILNVLGVDAYRGATQLNLIEASGGDNKLYNTKSQTGLNELYPHEAKYLIDHVVYLPINKYVPFHDLDKMLKACQVALELSRQPDCKTRRTRTLLLKSKL